MNNFQQSERAAIAAAVADIVRLCAEASMKGVLAGADVSGHVHELDIVIHHPAHVFRVIADNPPPLLRESAYYAGWAIESADQVLARISQIRQRVERAIAQSLEISAAQEGKA